MSRDNNDLSYRLFAVGNALVDKIAFVSKAFLDKFSLPLGRMALSNHEQQRMLLETLIKEQLIRDKKAGGSAANTLYTVSCLSNSNPGVFYAKVADDDLGQFFVSEMKNKNIRFPVLPVTQGEHRMTGTSIVLTTSDGERTMSTNLGINERFSEQDINEEDLQNATFCYLEGYLWTKPQHQKAAHRVFTLAKKHNVPVALSFSDPVVAREFLLNDKQMIDKYVDIIFSNLEEALYYTGCDKPEDALRKLKTSSSGRNRRIFLTLGAEGCLFSQAHSEKIGHVAGRRVKVVDTTGAGDAFAGGVLALLSTTNSWTNLHESAIIGNYIASEVVTIHGSRIIKNYSTEQILTAYHASKVEDLES